MPNQEMARRLSVKITNCIRLLFGLVYYGLIRIDLANFCKLCHLAGIDIQLYLCNMNQFASKRHYCPDE